MSAVFGIDFTDHLVFLLCILNMVNYIDWFLNVELSLYFWDMPHLVIYIVLFVYCCTLFGNILLEMFSVMFMRDIDF